MAHFTRFLVAVMLVSLVMLAQPAAADRDATLAFLQRLKNGIPALNSIWNQGDNYCNWPHVTCENPVDGTGVSIDLSGMKLVGTLLSIANIDGSKVSIKSINFANNKDLSSLFPESWADLLNLTHLDLSNTNMFGNIPDAWEKLINLSWLNLSTTKACWTLPNWDLSKMSLQVADFSNNNFVGTLPEQWGSLLQDIIANISGNSFCGCIPSTWTSNDFLKNLINQVNGLLGQANCEKENKCTIEKNFKCYGDSASAPLNVFLAVAIATLTALTVFFAL